MQNRTDLRVLTYNVLAPQHADWAARRPVIQAGIDALDPDVIALQEDTGFLDTGFAVARHSRPSPDGVGAALYSRWPIRDVRELDLRVTDRVDLPWAAAVAAEIDAPFGPLLVVHHKPAWQFGYARERERQAVACARFVEDLVAGRDLHVVLTGDFDDPPDSAAIRFWTGKQSLDGVSVAYQDAWTGPEQHTFTPENPLVAAGEMPLDRGRRIDYVLVRCGVHGPTLEVTGCRRCFDEPVGGVWPSDHFGVVADLAVPAHPPGRWA
jgi:endonuclease/exonuclease/phosphatase family metal-dependent hydrolase